MAYRNPYVEADLRENDLRRIADLGRLRAERLRREQEKREAEERRKEQLAKQKEAIETAKARKAMLPGLVTKWASYRTPIPLIYSLFAWPTIPFLPDVTPWPVTSVVWFAAIAPVLLVLLAHWMTRRAMEREREWLDGFSFAVDGYWNALPSGYRKRRIGFTFSGRAPAKELVTDLLCAREAERWRIDDQTGTGQVALVCDHYLSLRENRDAFRAALEVGRLLADVYPIRSASLSSS